MIAGEKEKEKMSHVTDEIAVLDSIEGLQEALRNFRIAVSYESKDTTESLILALDKYVDARIWMILNNKLFRRSGE